MKFGLTVFIPLYNEADILVKNVTKLTDHLDRLNLSYEIILGSNGSTDRTPKVGAELAQTYPQVKFFHLASRGPGLAFAEAVRLTEYSLFLCLDADLSTELNFIPRAVEALRDYDAVVGSKQTGNQKRPFIRVLASETFIVCSNLLLGMPYRDYSIGVKAYRTPVIRPFLHKVDRHTFYTQALLYQLQKTDKKIIEVPVTCADWRKSKFNLLHEGFYRYFKLFELWIEVRGKR